MSLSRLIARLERVQKSHNPSSQEMKTALTRIGSVLQAEMRLNIGRHKMIDRGRLLNSIKYEIEQSGDTAFLSVGSFGIRYAAMNEFGGAMSRAQVRAMFVALREQNGKVKRSGKGIITINPDGTGWWRERPFIRPAIIKHREFMLDMLRTLGK
jgi:phage gpG-like protein